MEFFGAKYNQATTYSEQHLLVKCPVCTASVDARCRGVNGFVLNNKTHNDRVIKARAKIAKDKTQMVSIRRDVLQRLIMELKDRRLAAVSQ